MVRPVRLTYGDVGDEEKLEKDRTLMLRPIMTDWTRPVATSTLLETTGRWSPTSGQFEQLRLVIT